ncbi:MAG: AI-2E family transporter [Flavobacterium sp.]
MTSKVLASGILRAIGIIVAIALLLFLLYKVQTVIIYLVISLILTLIGDPIAGFLKRRLKFKNTLAVSVTVFIFILSLVGFLLLFLPLIISQSESLSLFDTHSFSRDFNKLLNHADAYLSNYNIDINRLYQKSNIASKLNFDFLPMILNSIISTISNVGVAIASILFITFFFLKDKLLFLDLAKRILPDKHEDKILNSIDKINYLLSRYFIGLLLQLFIVFVLYLIVLLLFGIENAFIIAFLCAILNVIPYIGPIIATVLAIVLTMLGNLNADFTTQILPTTIYVTIGFCVVQIIDNNISQPIIFSTSVKSHPLEIFLSIVAAGFIFGVVGMILAVPVFTILKVVSKEFFPKNKVIQLLTKNI